MPITLYTGLPGAGKSLGLVEHMLKLRRSDADRAIYAHGIDGLVPGIAQPLVNVEDWESLPHGSLVVVDECQELMPADRGNTPGWIRSLSRHRHIGVDFLIATQHPSLISVYVRRLVAEHFHHVRKFGSTVVDRYRWAKCQDGPETPIARREAIKTLWRFPRECFAYYHSASVHTIKRKLPRKVFWLAAMAVMTICAVVAVPLVLGRASAANHAAIAPAVSAVDASSRSASLDSSDSLRRDNYSAWLRPRVDGVPWSAPAFDALKVTAQPSIMCMAGEDGRCECQTEQGTRYSVSLQVCRTIVRDGLYNPFLPSDDTSFRSRDQLSTVQASVMPSPSMVSDDDIDVGPPRSVDAQAVHADYVPPEWVPDAKPFTISELSGD